MDYTKDYYGSDVIDALKKDGFIDTGCSTFFTHNPDGEPITCRNYDYAHRVSQEDSTITGLNIVLHCKPEGKYESIAMADAVWCDETNPLLQRGGPDMPGFDTGLIDIIPYECMGGINEKGLCVSILRVDIKKGDQPARYPIGSSMLLRYMLDDCANVTEAVKKVDTAIVTPEDWQDCHIYVTDADGDYAVIESRNSEVSVIRSDVVTNFYLTYDDIEDSYKNGKLREQAVMITDENGESEYSVGYGHGYHRFITIASQLESHRDTASEEYRTVMPESVALVVLQSAAQNPYTKASGISMTQYSAIYNNEKKSLEVWPFQNYQTSYAFDVRGTRIH
ncbi:MAG: linear amide C-N hydrolase [Lachnospiraceae bacterium]|nr:linear amide C-N hydrolase [Lachnospiraceae bacterium]